MKYREIWRYLVERPLATVAVVALVPRLALAVALNRADVWRLAPDSYQYIAVAEAAAKGHLAEFWLGYGQSLFDSTRTFTLQIQLLFEVFGPVRLAAQLISVGYGVLAAVLTTVLGRRLMSDRWALGAGLVVALLPSQIGFSSVAIRESVIWAMVASVVYLALRFWNAGSGRTTVGWAVLMVVPLVLLFWLRDHSALLLLWCLLALVVESLAQIRRRVMVLFAIVLFVPALFGMGLGGWEFAASSGGQLGTVRSSLGADAESAISRPLVVGDDSLGFFSESQPVLVGDDARGVLVDSSPQAPFSTLGLGAEYEPGWQEMGRGIDQKYVIAGDGRWIAVDDDLAATVSQFPTGLIAVAIRPFPWESGTGLSRTAAAMESPLWSCLFLLATVGVAARWRSDPGVRLLAAVVLIFTLAAAVTQGNLGTAFRHRGQILFALVLLAMQGAEILWVRWSSERVGSRR